MWSKHWTNQHIKGRAQSVKSDRIVSISWPRSVLWGGFNDRWVVKTRSICSNLSYKVIRKSGMERNKKSSLRTEFLNTNFPLLMVVIMDSYRLVNLPYKTWSGFIEWIRWLPHIGLIRKRLKSWHSFLTFWQLNTELDWQNLSNDSDDPINS